MLREGINGGDIAAITMQDAENVDDIVVTLRGEPSPQIFISATAIETLWKRSIDSSRLAAAANPAPPNASTVSNW